MRSNRGDVFSRINSYSKWRGADQYVFSRCDSPDILSKDLLYSYFGDLIKKVEAKHPDFDASKTLYSLRHMFITIRLLAQQNPYDIARFCGTKLKQIEEHYDNVQDYQVSRRLLATSIKFDKNGEIYLEDDS